MNAYATITYGGRLTSDSIIRSIGNFVLTTSYTIIHQIKQKIFSPVLTEVNINNYIIKQKLESVTKARENKKINVKNTSIIGNFILISSYNIIHTIKQKIFSFSLPSENTNNHIIKQKLESIIKAREDKSTIIRNNKP